jgi:hypothetical protein
MESIPKIYANFKDGNFVFYFNNIKREIKQSPKLMVLYQFGLKSVYKFQTSWSDSWDNILISQSLNFVPWFRRLVAGPSTLKVGQIAE